MYWCRDAVGKFPDYPTEEEGGSLMIFKEKDPAEVEAALKALVSIQISSYAPVTTGVLVEA